MEYGKKTRIGGFDLLKYKNVHGQSFIKVSTVMGNWSVEYREDCSLYTILDTEHPEEETNALHVMLANGYFASTLLDAEFQHGVLLLISEYEKRMNAEVEQVSEEEDKEIIENMKTETEILTEMMKNGDIKLDDEEIKLPESDNKEELSGEGWSVKAGENFDLKV